MLHRVLRLSEPFLVDGGSVSTTDSSATRLSLISRVRTNDASAWQELVHLYTPLVAFWCRKRSVRESEINDLVQDVFFTVCRSLDGYQVKSNGIGFRAWLWTITRNKIIDSLRREHRMPVGRGGSTALLASQQVPEQLDENDASERHEFTAVLHRALDQVRCEFEERTWAAFWRTTIDGQSVASVAGELNVAPATVRKHRSRILRRMRQQLGETLT